MTFNEFQRELRKRGIEGNTAFMFALIYERLIHVSNEVDTNAKALLAIANSMQGLVGLHEATQSKLKDVLNRQEFVVSVPNEPEDE